MNKLDKQYTDLLQDILDNGVTKNDRTGTGTISVFGRQIRHDMKTGFPLLTTKKMHWKSIVTELLWFLRGDTNIKYLVDNGCHIWDGDCFANYKRKINLQNNWEVTLRTMDVDTIGQQELLSQEEFINRIKTDDEFAKKWGSLGPVYGKQWRSWNIKPNIETKSYIHKGETHFTFDINERQPIDQIQNLINDLKTNPDSRRLMVNAWNVGELDSMVLPPCHYGFQVYTRELSYEERCDIFKPNTKNFRTETNSLIKDLNIKIMNDCEIPTRAVSLQWNQRSVDTFLGLPFNIASYGLLLEIIAKAVNMVPDELIGNLGDTHLYSNHIEQAKEQIGRELSLKERHQLALPIWKEKYGPLADMMVMTNVDNTPYEIPKRTREPYPLPTLNINTEFWPYEGGECGEGPLDAVKVFESFKNESFCKCLLEEDIQLSNYQSHPSIKATLSN
jgi:thymidylate synthase